MKIIRNIISFILIILLSVVILLIFFLENFHSTILNTKYIFQKLEEANYYENTYNEIHSAFEEYIGPSGLDESVLNDIYTKEQVTNDIKETINNIYKGNRQEIETAEIRKKLDDNIYSTINKNINENEKKSISDFETTIENEYKNQITHHNYLSKLEEYIPKINKNFKIVEIILIFAILSIIIILFLINLKEKNKIIINIAISFFSSGVLEIFGKIFITFKIDISHIMILNETFSKVIIKIINDILNVWQNMGIASIVTSLLVFIISNYFLQNAKEKKFEQKSEKHIANSKN